MEKGNTSNHKPNRLKDYAKYSGMAFQMMAIIVLGVLGGIKIDEHLSLKTPVFTIILTLFSVFLAIYFSIKDFLKKK